MNRRVLLLSLLVTILSHAGCKDGLEAAADKWQKVHEEQRQQQAADPTRPPLHLLLREGRPGGLEFAQSLFFDTDLMTGMLMARFLTGQWPQTPETLIPWLSHLPQDAEGHLRPLVPWDAPLETLGPTVVRLQLHPEQTRLTVRCADPNKRQEWYSLGPSSHEKLYQGMLSQFGGHYAKLPTNVRQPWNGTAEEFRQYLPHIMLQPVIDQLADSYVHVNDDLFTDWSEVLLQFRMSPQYYRVATLTEPRQPGEGEIRLEVSPDRRYLRTLYSHTQRDQDQDGWPDFSERVSYWEPITFRRTSFNGYHTPEGIDWQPAGRLLVPALAWEEFPPAP